MAAGYHIQKYLVAPERMPEHLTWFKWESYATWLSGFAMLAIVDYAGGFFSWSTGRCGCAVGGDPGLSLASLGSARSTTTSASRS